MKKLLIILVFLCSIGYGQHEISFDRNVGIRVTHPKAALQIGDTIGASNCSVAKAPLLYTGSNTTGRICIVGNASTGHSVLLPNLNIGISGFNDQTTGWSGYFGGYTGNVYIKGDLQLDNSHIHSTQTTPPAITGTGTVTPSGYNCTDVKGVVSWTDATSSDVITVTFNVPYNDVPVIILGQNTDIKLNATNTMQFEVKVFNTSGAFNYTISY